MGKEKKEKRKSEGDDGNNKDEQWSDLLSRVGPIANPLASRKLTKKVYKAIKKAQKQKQLRKGVREVQKFIRKGEKGIVILAGDTNPVEVVCHMPCVCEDNDLSYCYTPSKQDLGAACGSKRPTCIVMVKHHEEYAELYDEVLGEVKSLPLPIS